MIRHFPMARATSLLAGWPVIYDLTQIEHLTGILPSFSPIVRDLENPKRSLRRKNFGRRPAVEIVFKIPHRRTLNSVARFYDVEGRNLLRSPLDLSASPWQVANASIAQSPERDPKGTAFAWRLTDASAAAGLVGQQTLSGGISARLSWFFRAATAHPTAAEITTSSPPGDVGLSVQADQFWRCASLVLPALSSPSSTFTIYLFFHQTDTEQGTVDLAFPDVRSISALPGTDEEILADLYDKLCSDDWKVEFSLDGGLTWREMLLEEYGKGKLEEKWIGWSISFFLIGVDVVQQVPATFDGVW